MDNHRIVGMGFILLLLTSLACNAFAGRRGSLPPPPVPTAALEGAATPGEPNLAPTVTLPADSLIEEAQGTVRILVDLNIRSGPGVRFDRVGFLLKDERSTVVGRDPQSGWWRIQCPANVNDAECWVSGGSQFTLLESGQ